MRIEIKWMVLGLLGVIVFGGHAWRKRPTLHRLGNSPWSAHGSCHSHWAASNFPPCNPQEHSPSRLSCCLQMIKIQHDCPCEYIHVPLLRQRAHHLHRNITRGNSLSSSNGDRRFRICRVIQKRYKMSDTTLFHTTDHFRISAHPESFWLGGWMDSEMRKCSTNPNYTSSSWWILSKFYDCASLLDEAWI